jgi:iron complex outermembrane recepter protein
MSLLPSRRALGAPLSCLLALCAPPLALAEDTVPEVVVTGNKDAPPEGRAEDGYRTSTGSFGVLGKTTLKEVPFSLNVTPGALIENSNAHTLGDALKTNPTATVLMAPSGYTSMTRMMVRGFTAADQSETRDGLVDRSFSFPPIENVDRIEVLNGFSGFLSGFSALGGAVNYVSKRPSDQPLYSVRSGFYGGGIAFGHADIGGPVPGTGDRLGYRLNAYHEYGSTFINGSNQKRTVVSNRMEYKIRDESRVWADAWHQEYKATGLQPYFALSAGVRVPDAFDATKQYGQSWTYNKAEKTVLGAGFDAKLNDTFTLRTGYRWGTMWRQYAYVGNTLNTNGTYTEKYTTSPRQNEVTHSAYALLDATFDTWGIGHTVTGGYTGTDYSYDRGDDVSVTLGSSTIASPAVYANPNRRVGGTNTWQSNYLDNYLISDRIAVTDWLSVLAGITHAAVKQRAHGTGTAISTSNYRKTAYTPSAAVMVKPWADTTLYASYMEALVGGESTSVATAVNKNTVLDPSISRQYEIGAKTTLHGVDLSAALFRLDKVNSEIDPADNVFKQDGREVHQGIEFMASGRPLDNLTVGGGFTLMDARIEKAIANPALTGKIPVNVPKLQARLYAEYTLPWVPDVTLTGGVNYFGKRPVDARNTDYLDAATTVDAGLRYEPEVLGHKVSAALTVANVFDKRYWAYFRSGDGLLAGAPRVVSVSVKATW